MLLELFLVGGTDDDATIAIAHFSEDGSEAEAEDDGNEDGTERIGHDLLEHLDKTFYLLLFFF